MTSYLKTMLSGLRQWITAQKADWSQNDETAANYIKGRPCYETDPKMEYLIKDETVTLETLEDAPGDWAAYGMESPLTLESGKTYTVTWDGKEYSVVGTAFEELVIIGNMLLVGGDDTGEPFAIATMSNSSSGVYGLGAGSHTFSVATMTSETVQLPAKYLPTIPAEKLPTIPAEKVHGLASVATSGQYSDLAGTPTVPADIVRYATSQSLTDAQKTRARTNIGAGTSSFDGKYSSLTGAPSLAAVATSGSYADLSDVPEHVQADYAENDERQTAFVRNRPCYEGEQARYYPYVFSISTHNGGMIESRYYGYKRAPGNFMNDKTYVISKYNYEGHPVVRVVTYTDAQNSTQYTKTIKILGNASIVNNGSLLQRLLGSSGYVTLDDMPDTGENFAVVLIYINSYKDGQLFLVGMSDDITMVNTDIVEKYDELKQLDERYIPSTIQRTGGPVILSDANGAKWRLTVGADGALTTEAVTE